MIVGSTRPNRFATPWRRGSSRRQDLQLAVLDLSDVNLPMFNEPASPTFTNGVFSEPAAEVGRKRLGEFDAFVAITPKYDHGPSAVLKNAFDSSGRTLNDYAYLGGEPGRDVRPPGVVGRGLEDGPDLGGSRAVRRSARGQPAHFAPACGRTTMSWSSLTIGMTSSGLGEPGP
jgi:hypothetical protein